jgi:hypothetical protein
MRLTSCRGWPTIAVRTVWADEEPVQGAQESSDAQPVATMST